MEQDDRRTLAAPRAPAAYKDATAWNFYERVQEFGTRCVTPPSIHGPLQRVSGCSTAIGLTQCVAMLATLIKNTVAAATSAQIVKFMTAEWCAMDARV